MFDRLLQSENTFRRQRVIAFAKALFSVPMLANRVLPVVYHI